MGSKLTEAECLQITLGILGSCKNAGFLNSYILQRELSNGKGILSIEETTEIARQVYEVQESAVRAAQLAEMKDQG